MASRRRQVAEKIAQALVERLPSLEGICLFGSVARGDEDEWSDIDLLVVGSDAALTPTTLINQLPESLRGERLSVLYYLASDLEEMYVGGDLFVEHLRQDGVVLWDRSGLLRRVLEGPFAYRGELRDALRVELTRLSPYDDLRRFNGNFLFCLAHLYAIGKSVVFLYVANEDTSDFNRERAFATFRRTHPELADEVDTIQALAPFYHLVTKRKGDETDRPYGSADQAARAVEAIKTLIAKGLDARD